MKITGVKPIVADGGHRIIVFAKVETDQPGLVGWGEATLEAKPRWVAGCVTRCVCTPTFKAIPRNSWRRTLYPRRKRAGPPSRPCRFPWRGLFPFRSPLANGCYWVGVQGNPRKSGSQLAAGGHLPRGGISEMRRISAMAEICYAGIAPHNPYGPLATAACVQVDRALAENPTLRASPKPMSSFTMMAR